MIEPDDLGPEIPAVVDLLLHRGEPSGNAVAATVLDLAARGYLELEETSPDSYLCRVPHRGDSDALTSYEAQVMALLRDRAHDDVVPAEALTAGVDDEASEWWERFRRHVHVHAREQGLTRTTWLLSAVVVVAVAASGLAFWWWNDSWAAIVVFGVVLAAAITMTVFPDSWLQPPRLTPHGRAVRARWRRRRHELGASGGFVDVPPTGVVIWDRYLAYAAALGLAPAACNPLPLGPDSTRFAWVRRDGTWQRLRVRVPRRVLPGSGRPATVGLVAGLVATAVAITTLVLALEPGRWHPSPPFADDVADLVGDLEPFVVAIALVILVLGLWELGLAVAAMLAAPRVVEGTIVSRCVRQGWRSNPWRGLLPAAHYVVVDDGASETLPGWRVPKGAFAELARGDAVTVWVDTTIHRVRAVDRSSGAPGAATPGRRGRRGRARGGRDGGPSS